MTTLEVYDVFTGAIVASYDMTSVLRYALGPGGGQFFFNTLGMTVLHNTDLYVMATPNMMYCEKNGFAKLNMSTGAWQILASPSQFSFLGRVHMTCSNDSVYVVDDRLGIPRILKFHIGTQQWTGLPAPPGRKWTNAETRSVLVHEGYLFAAFCRHDHADKLFYAYSLVHLTWQQLDSSLFLGAVPDSPDGLFALDNGDILISDKKVNTTHKHPQCIIPLDVVRSHRSLI
jgi:hypothetical protein